MNTNKQKKSSFILTIILNLLLITAVIFGITTAYFRDKKSTSGTIKFANGIILDYKGFGATGDKESGVWNDENSALLNLFNVSGVFPGDSVLINTPNDIKANAESSAFFARYKIDYEFLDINGDKVELSDPSLLITPGAKFNNSTKWAYSTDNYYYYVKEDLTTLESFTNQSDFVSLFADGAYFLIEGDGFIADKNGGFTVEGKNSIMKIKVNLILEVIQDSIDPESVTPIWKVIAPNVQSNIARLSDFDYNVIDSNNDGVTGGEDDYIVLNKYNGSLTNYTVLKHYTVKQENDSFIDATDYDNISVVAVGDKYKLPVKQLGNNETFDNDVKNITIPDSIDKIGNGALKDSTVENVKLKINEGTENEQDIVVFTKDKELAKEASNVISTTPKATEWLKGVYIGYEAFVGTKIKDVVIPEGVEFTINKKAFDDTVGFTYKGTKYNTLEELQEAMKTLGDTLTIDSSVLYTPAISGGGVSNSTSYYRYDPTGEYSYIDSYGTWSFDLDENNNAIIRTYIPASKYGEVTLDSDGNILTGQISELTLPSHVTNGSATYTVIGINSIDLKKGEKFKYSVPKYTIYNSDIYGNNERFNGSLTIPSTYKEAILGDVFVSVIELTIESSSIYLSGFFGKVKTLIANNLEKIDDTNFQTFKYLENVSMPKLKEILSIIGAFTNCTNLKRFNSSIDGVFDLTNVRVIYGDQRTSDGAFEGCTSVQKVYFGQNVYIGARAFKNCSNLTNIYFVSDSTQVNMSTNNITPINIPVSLANNSVSTIDYVDDASIVGYITTEQYKSQIGKDFGYNISSSCGTVTIQGVEGTTVKAGTYNITINLGTGNGYIGEIYYIVSTTSGYTTQTITVGSSNSAPTSYTLENFEITGSVYFKIARYYKITKNDVVSYEPNVTVGRNYSETNNTLEYYEDQFGNKYYYGTAYYPNNFDLILTTKTEKIYKVITDGYNNRNGFFADKVVEHNNFKFKLPIYVDGYEEYLKGKYIAGWTDNNGHTYMFEKRFTSNGTVDISSEIVNIQNLTEDITLYPIWKDINYKVNILNPNHVVIQGGIKYTYNSILLSRVGINDYWYDVDENIWYTDSPKCFYIKDVNRKIYNLAYQLSQSSDSLWATVDNIIGYNGKVYNIDAYKFNTGYISEIEGPTSEKSTYIGLTGINEMSYFLPEPTPRDGYKCIGWTNTKNENYWVGTTIKDLTPTTWTAIWVKIDTGYISDTEGPTTTKTLNAQSISNGYILPSAPEANKNYYFIGWENSNGDIYEAGIRIDNLTPTTWKAKWTHIDIDTGYISDTEGPTTVKTISITGIYNKSYYLPKSPKSNEKYYFIGWKNNNGDVYRAEYSQKDLSPTTWTAVWLKIGTGYISETEGPTTVKNPYIDIIYENNKMISYKLPYIDGVNVINSGYGFIGWSKDGGNTFIKEATITDFVYVEWKAFYLSKDNVIIDTGFVDNAESPTSTQTAFAEIGNEKTGYKCYVSFPTLTANKNYYLVGFKKENIYTKNYINSEGNELIGTWKAIWVKVDTGYVADSTSPTTTESLEITIENKTVDGSLKYSYTIKDNYSYLQRNNGYCLVGWTNDGGNTVVKNVQVEQENFESTTWTAVWKYGKASFNTGYTQTDSPTSTQRIDDIYPTLNSNNELVIKAPYIEAINGYNFMGWRKIGEEKLYKYNETIIINGNVTFEAVYSKNSYTVVYEVEEGVTYTGTLPNDSNNYTIGDEVTLLNPDNVQVEGKFFDRYEIYQYIDGNWNYYSEFYPENVISVYHNLKIVLKFRAPYNFNIQFNNTRNNNLNNINGTEGTSVTLPSISDNEQGLYEFIGWEYNGVTIPGNKDYTFTGISYDGETIYLYAKWNYIGTLYNVSVNGAQISSVRYKIGSSDYDDSTLMEGNSANSILQQDKEIYLFISINNGYIIDSIYVNSNEYDRGIEYRFDGNTCIARLFEHGGRYNSDLNFEINFKQVTDEIIEVKLYSNLTNDYSKTGLTTYYAVKGNRLLDKNGSNILANRPNETPSDLTVFAGWFKADGTYIDYNNFKVTENIELYARWGNISVRDINQSQNEEGIYILTLNSTNLVTIREIFKKGYSYKNGFVIEYNGTQYDIADKDGKFIPNVKASDETIFTDADGKWVYAEIYNIKIYAKEPTQATYNIIYELDGGTMDTSKTTYTYSEDFYLKAPTKEGYTFVGFDYTVIGINKDHMYSKTVEVNGVTYLIWNTNDYNIYDTYGDKTFKAIWTPINYTVKFDVNGGEEIFEDLITNITNEYKVTIYEQQPTRFGFTFNGWSDGTNVYSAGQQITINPADTTLTAVWVGNDITVSAPSEYSSIFSNLKSGNEITIPNDSDSISGILAFTLTFTVKEGTQEYKLKGGDKLIAPGATNLTVTVNEVEKVTLTIKHNTSETDTNETIITAYQGYTVKELPANIVKDGCLFDVLSSTSTREGTLTTLPMILTTNTTLYVIWKEAGISQTITRDNQLRFDAFWEWLDAIDQTTNNLDSEEYNSKFTFEVFKNGSYIEDKLSNSIGIREAVRAINSFTINKNIVTFTAEADGMVIEGKLEIVWESSINRLVYKNWELKTNDGVIVNGLKVKGLTPAENTQDYIMVDLSIINAMSTENHTYNINLVGGEGTISVLGGKTSAKVTFGENVMELTHEVAGADGAMIALLGSVGGVNTLCCNYFDYEFKSLTVNGNTYTLQVMVENTPLTVTHTIQKSGEDYVMVSTSCPKELIRT